jgi:hypothetical protein
MRRYKNNTLLIMSKFRLELVWNREFNWSTWGHDNDLNTAKKSLISIRDSGDGARVKKVRIVDTETDKVLWDG